MTELNDGLLAETENSDEQTKLTSAKDTENSDEVITLNDEVDPSELENSQEKEKQRERSAAGQIERAKRFLDAGQEIPKDLQWALKHIEAPSDEQSKIKTANVVSEKSIEDLLTYKEKEKDFAKLSKGEQQKAKEKFQLFRSKGFEKGEALKLSLEFVDGGKSQKARAQALANNAKLTESGDSSTEDYSENDLDRALKMPAGSKEKLDILRKLAAN